MYYCDMSLNPKPLELPKIIIVVVSGKCSSSRVIFFLQILLTKTLCYNLLSLKFLNFLTEQDGGDWASGHGTHGMALPSDDGAGATGRNRMTYPPSEDVLQAQDDNRPLPSSRLTEVNKVSVEEGAEDEEVSHSGDIFL